MRDREITIVKDYWDLKSDRIQIITGLFLATASLLALWLLADRDFSNSIAHVYSVSLIDVYSTTQSTAIARALTELDANYLTVLRLFLHVMTGIFAGLTAMEVTKLFGNRRGVMHAVWVALIYAVCRPVSRFSIRATDYRFWAERCFPPSLSISTCVIVF